MYAIVKTGGKQYRVEQGQTLLVERLPAAEGDSVALDPLLYVDDSQVLDQVDGLSSVQVQARVVGHERGPKLRVVKFKPKRGYKRRTGHRQELTRLEIVSVKLSGRGRGGGRRGKAAEGESEAAAESSGAKAAAGPKPARGGAKAAGEPKPGSARAKAAEPEPATAPAKAAAAEPGPATAPATPAAESEKETENGA
jgi:large subunit ribosomal protein L21